MYWETVNVLAIHTLKHHSIFFWDIFVARIVFSILRFIQCLFWTQESPVPFLNARKAIYLFKSYRCLNNQKQLTDLKIQMTYHFLRNSMWRYNSYTEMVKKANVFCKNATTTKWILVSIFNLRKEYKGDIFQDLLRTVFFRC